ncbi:MAG: YggT family protein [Beijerinckiaceae bacterium]|nr:YggT family protein [Beijerinckiaceae bacterium]
MRALLEVILIALNFYIYILIASAIFSWLIAFNVINTRSPVVSTIVDVLYRLTEPLLQPIRRFLPSFGGLDLSFIVLWLLIELVRRIIVYNIYPLVPF